MESPLPPPAGGMGVTRPGPPTSAWAVLLIDGILLFPLGLLLSWGIYRRKPLAWHLTGILLGLGVFLCALGLVSLGESLRSGTAGALFLAAALIYSGLMWRTKEPRKWRTASIVYAVILLSALALAFSGSTTSAADVSPVVIAVGCIVVAVLDILAYSVSTRAWCRVRLGWAGPVVDLIS
jgi:hypothetical protein